MATCSPGPRHFGQAVAEERAIPLSSLGQGADGSEVVVRGVITEVCRSSGCWCTLQQLDGDRVHELHIDLAAAPFRLPPEARGHAAVVSGTLIERDGTRQLLAAGVTLR